MVIGLVVGTFTYSLVVLTAAPQPPDETGQVYVARLSVTVAVLLAVVAVLAIIAFIDRSARSMQVGQTIQRVARDTRARIGHLLAYQAGEGPKEEYGESPLPEGEPYTVRSARDGWIQGVQESSLAGAVAEGSVIRVGVRVGTFVVARTPLCTVWPTPDDCERTEARARQAFVIGRERTMWEDITFGAPTGRHRPAGSLAAVNDPTTAEDAVGGIGGILSELLHRDLPPRVRHLEGRRIYRPKDLGATAYVDLGFEQIRVAGASQPDVCIGLLHTLARLQEKLVADGLPERTAALRRQAGLVVLSAEQTCPIAEDRDRVRKVAEDLDLLPTS